MEGRTETLPPLKNTSFLLVAGNEVLRNTVSDLMTESLQTTPLVAENNATALKVLEEAQKKGASLDIVLTDLSGPDIQGIELAQEIKERNLARLGTMIMTVDPSQIPSGERQRLVNQGIVSAILTKGTDFPDQLRQETAKLTQNPS